MVDDLNTFFDSREVPNRQSLDYDLVVIGAAAAGITIAKEFSDTNLNLCLLESGGFVYEQEIENLNKCKVIGHDLPSSGSRLRFFGGSTNHWGGHCAPIRQIAFEKREWIPYSGWPFGLEELKPYYKRAHKIIGIGDFEYDPTIISKQLGLALFPLDPEYVETQLSRYHPQRFGPAYLKELNDARNVSVFLHATVTSISLDSDKHSVTNVNVRTLNANNFTIKAKYFVLATGGIENARILLLNNQDMPNGLGNKNDLVGRFFQDHIWYPRGFILPADQDIKKAEIYRTEKMLGENYAIKCHLILPESRVRELRIPEYRVELEITRSRKFSESIRSIHRLRRAMKSKRYDISSNDIWNILKDPFPPIAKTFDEEGSLVYGFNNHVEQVPNPNSRIILNQDKDALGQSRVSVDWQLSSIDKEGIVRAQQLIAKEIGRSGIGRMNVFTTEDEETILEGASSGGHHMGTTRMHIDPKQGVVDPTCRIYGLDNIYIAGSSVFPNAGFPNPTLTITALAVRLADQLKDRFSKS